MSDKNRKFTQIAQQLGYDFDGQILIGGHYVSLIEHQGVIEVSGQIPRVGSTVMVTGRVGEMVSLFEA